MGCGSELWSALAIDFFLDALWQAELLSALDVVEMNNMIVVITSSRTDLHDDVVGVTSSSALVSRRRHVVIGHDDVVGVTSSWLK